MMEAYYLVLVIFYSGKGVTIEKIPQASIALCVERHVDIVKRMKDDNINVFAYCVPGEITIQ